MIDAEWTVFIRRVIQNIVRSRLAEKRAFAKFDEEFHRLLECHHELGVDAKNALHYLEQFRDCSVLVGTARTSIWKEHLVVGREVVRRKFAEAKFELRRHIRSSFRRWSSRLFGFARKRSLSMFQELVDVGGVLVVASLNVTPVEWEITPDEISDKKEDFCPAEMIAQIILNGSALAYFRPTERCAGSFASKYLTRFASHKGWLGVEEEFRAFQQRVRECMSRLSRNRNIEAILESHLLLFQVDPSDLFLITGPDRTLGLFCYDNETVQLTQRRRVLARIGIAPELQIIRSETRNLEKMLKSSIVEYLNTIPTEDLSQFRLKGIESIRNRMVATGERDSVHTGGLH